MRKRTAVAIGSRPRSQVTACSLPRLLAGVGVERRKVACDAWLGGMAGNARGQKAFGG